MNGVVFKETLRRGWRGMLYWGLGFGLYGLMIMMIVKDANILKQYGEISKALPPALLQLFGGDAASMIVAVGLTWRVLARTVWTSSGRAESTLLIITTSAICKLVAPG